MRQRWDKVWLGKKQILLQAFGNSSFMCLDSFVAYFLHGEIVRETLYNSDRQNFSLHTHYKRGYGRDLPLQPNKERKEQVVAHLQLRVLFYIIIYMAKVPHVFNGERLAMATAMLSKNRFLPNGCWRLLD